MHDTDGVPDEVRVGLLVVDEVGVLLAVALAVREVDRVPEGVLVQEEEGVVVGVAEGVLLQVVVRLAEARPEWQCTL